MNTRLLERRRRRGGEAEREAGVGQNDWKQRAEKKE